MKITRVVGVTLLSLLLSHATHGAEETAPQFATVEDAITAITHEGKSKFPCPFDNCSTTCADRAATANHIHSSQHFGTRIRCPHCNTLLALSTVRRSPHKNGNCLN